MYDNFSELIRKKPYLHFFSIYRPSHHKIQVLIGPVAKEILIRPRIKKPIHSVGGKIKFMIPIALLQKLSS